MPICSYLVIPAAGETAAVMARLDALAGCEVVRAQNRELLALVTDTAGPAEERALRAAIEGIDGICAVVLTFGELHDEGGAA
jgi:nitrate reductase NapAB chaperone NapD